MRAVVLVGGFGTRLRPLTETVPKPMLPVGHVPIIERLVGNLERSGITEVTLALGFKPQPFIDAFPDNRIGEVDVRYAIEPEPLDTAGAIRFAADHAGIDDTFVVANGDILTSVNIADLITTHRVRRADATLHLTQVDDPSRFGVVDVANDGRVRRFVEKPAPGTAPSNLINAGTYVMEPSVLERIPQGRRVSVEREVFPQLATDGRVFSLCTLDYWLDTGTVPLYLQANLDLLQLASIAGVHANAVVDVSASIRQSVVGGGATVAAQAVIERSVILPGAYVGVGAIVTDSVVMGRVGAQSVVVDSVLGADGVVAVGEQIQDLRRPFVDL